MEKSFRIIYTLLLCLLAVSANAQKNKKDKDEVKISAAKYDKFRDDIKLLSDSTKTLADSCTSLNSIIQNLQKEKEYLDDVIRNNKKDIEEKVAIIGEKNALIASMQQQHKADSLTMSTALLSMSEMQKQRMKLLLNMQMVVCISNMMPNESKDALMTLTR